jgi:hypothetical protein
LIEAVSEPEKAWFRAFDKIWHPQHLHQYSAEHEHATMVDLGSSGAPNVTSVSRNATAFCRLRLRRSRLELCVPVEPAATDCAVVAPNCKVI